MNITLQEAENLADLTSLGHIVKYLQSDPEITGIVQIVDADLEIGLVGMAFINGDWMLASDWNLAGQLVVMGGDLHLHDLAQVSCIRVEPFYIVKKTGKLHV